MKKDKPIAALALSIALAVATAPILAAPDSSVALHQPALTSRAIASIDIDGLQFRDLDRDGSLDPYEDWRRTAEERAEDLLSRMTLAEKVGQMVVANAPGDAPWGQASTGYAMDDVRGMFIAGHVTHYNSALVLDAEGLARSANALQEMAETGRLGIPIVISTDPRHHFQQTAGASVGAGSFSQWPEPLGFGAIDDPALLRHFADIVRRDYRATGFAMALSPQADLATEPRWPRINGTFGEDPERVSRLVPAYIEGAQGGPDGLHRGGVAVVVKHFAGYGAAKGGWDAHNRYGRFADLSQDEFARHLAPFEAAFAVHPSGVMPAYSVLPPLSVGDSTIEPVGAGYSRTLIGGLLRNHYGFDGVVLSDWAITQDCGDICNNGFPPGVRPSFEGMSTAWGVEDLSKPERFALAVAAGIDQFGGVNDPAPIIDAVEAGLIDPIAIDNAVRPILIQSFELGLFETPFVDPDAAARITGTDADRAQARRAQARAMVVLKDRGILPLKPGTRVFLRNADASAAQAAGLVVVARPEDADIAIVRTSAPFETPHPQFFFGSIQHEGSLAFRDDDPDLVAARALWAKLPTIVDVYLDRPAILKPFQRDAAVLLGNFGAADDAFFDALTGVAQPEGMLPLELPSSMDAVEHQRPGSPADSLEPLYGLNYRKTK